MEHLTGTHPWMAPFLISLSEVHIHTWSIGMDFHFSLSNGNLNTLDYHYMKIKVSDILLVISSLALLAAFFLCTDFFLTG